MSRATPLRHDAAQADVVTRTAHGDGLPEEGFAITGLAYEGKVPFNGREADAFATTARGGTRNGIPEAIPVLLICADADVAGKLTGQVFRGMTGSGDAFRHSYEGRPLPLSRKAGRITILVTRALEATMRDRG